jgi:hypothetical protein
MPTASTKFQIHFSNAFVPHILRFPVALKDTLTFPKRWDNAIFFYTGYCHLAVCTSNNRWSFSINVIHHWGRAMAQVVSSRPLTAEARVRARVNPCGILVDKVALGQAFHRVLRFSPVNTSFHRRSPNSYHLRNVQHANVSRHPRLGTRPTPPSGEKYITAE